MAGLRSSDVLAAINGQTVDDERSVNFRLATLPIDGMASLTVLRAGRQLALRLPLQPPPEVPRRDTTSFTGRSPFDGATVMNLSPAVADELALDAAARGVVVAAIRGGSPAARYLEAHDIVVSVNGKEVATVKELQAVLDNNSNRWNIVLRRNGRTISMTLRG